MTPAPQPAVARLHDLHAVLSAGDAACAQDRPEALVEAARLLGVCVDEIAHVELEAVARLAETDPTAAAAAWHAVTDPLRRRLFADDDEPSARRSG